MANNNEDERTKQAWLHIFKTFGLSNVGAELVFSEWSAWLRDHQDHTAEEAGRFLDGAIREADQLCAWLKEFERQK